MRRCDCINCDCINCDFLMFQLNPKEIPFLMGKKTDGNFPIFLSKLNSFCSFFLPPPSFAFPHSKIFPRRVNFQISIPFIYFCNMHIIKFLICIYNRSFRDLQQNPLLKFILKLYMCVCAWCEQNLPMNL